MSNVLRVREDGSCSQFFEDTGRWGMADFFGKNLTWAFNIQSLKPAWAKVSSKNKAQQDEAMHRLMTMLKTSDFKAEDLR